MPLSCNSIITLGTLQVGVRVTRTGGRRVLQSQYGDGYLDRRLDGINTATAAWAIRTPPLTEDQWRPLEEELGALGPAAFSWQPPGEEEAQSWVLSPVQWNREVDGMYATYSWAIRKWYGAPG